MIPLVASLLSKVFIYVLAGVFAGIVIRKKGEKYAKMAIWFILYVLIPLFIFNTVWTNSISFANAWKTVATAFFVISGGAFLVFLWSKLESIPFKKYALSVAFMNSAFLAIPVSALLWGRTGAQYAIIYNVVLTVCIFTVGVFWASGKSSLVEIFKLPEIYAIISGFVLYFLKIQPPPILAQGLDNLSHFTLSAVLIFVGYRIAKIRVSIVKDAVIGVLIRIFGGWLLALAAVQLLAIPYPEKGICIMSSAMPTAVMAYVISEEFNADAEFAAAAVILGSILSFFTIPLIGYLYSGR